MISSQWTEESVLPPLPAEPGRGDCANVASRLFDGVVNEDAILPRVTDQRGIDKPFLGNTTMESYQRSNCMGCHTRAGIAQDDGEEQNTDFMYFLSLKTIDRQSNEMIYDLTDERELCAEPAGMPVMEFKLEGVARGSVVPGQSFDLLVAIELPQNVNSPALRARNAQYPSKPWVFNGEPVSFATDPLCTAGDCTADRLFPPADGHRWVQFRSTVPLTATEEAPGFSGLLWFYLPGSDCEEAPGTGYRVWASDDSQYRYANFVDGALVEGKMGTFSSILTSALPWDDINPIPALGPAVLAFLLLALLSTGLIRIKSKIGNKRAH